MLSFEIMFIPNSKYSYYSALPTPSDDHEQYEKVFNDTLENARFYQEQIKAKKALDLSSKMCFKVFGFK